MAITFFGVATTPADNSAQAGPTVALTPPASMQDGDLVYVSVRYRASSGTISVGTTGGQAWQQVGAQYNATNIRAAVFWCRFNGTWAADPDFTVGAGTNNMDAQMLVYRPTSAAYTWTVESGPNGATYTAPSTPFTVSITGRDTTAASTVTIAAWHSIDDNSWGSLSGTDWSKTSLGAQYRNNSTADNSSTFAYNIRTSAGTVANVSQNQSALGGDAGSTSLVTFAETLVTATPSGVAGTSAAGSLGISQTISGLDGLELTASAGTITVPEGSGANATATPTGAVATAALGTLALLLSPVVVPTGAGVGAAAGTPTAIITVVPTGVAGTADAGTATGVGALGGVVPVGGVVSNAVAGSLGSAITVAGIAGVSSTASVGTASGVGGGILHGAGQPSTVFATAQVGSLAVLSSAAMLGVFATATAEDIGSSLVVEEIDGNGGTTSVGTTTPLVASPIGGAAASAVAGTLARVATAVVQATGVQLIATVGNVAGITAEAAAAVPGGVSASAEAGTLQVIWTFSVPIAGVSSSAEVGNAVVEGGDATPVEVFPSGVQATAQVGTVSTGEALAGITSVSVTVQVGAMTVVGAAAIPLDRPDALLVVAELEATISISTTLDATVRITPVT